jgi:hypothetical protein
MGLRTEDETLDIITSNPEVFFHPDGAETLCCLNEPLVHSSLYFTRLPCYSYKPLIKF